MIFHQAMKTNAFVMGIFCLCFAIYLHAVEVDELIPESESTLLETESVKDLLIAKQQIAKLQAKLASSNAKITELGARLRSMEKMSRNQLTDSVKSDQLVESSETAKFPATIFAVLGMAQFWVPKPTGRMYVRKSAKERHVKANLLDQKKVLKQKSKLTQELQLPYGTVHSTAAPPVATNAPDGSPLKAGDLWHPVPTSPSVNHHSGVAPAGSKPNAVDLDVWKAGSFKYPENGPINDKSSVCRKIWNSPAGPGIAGRKATAKSKKNTFEKTMEDMKDSSGSWSVGIKNGCSSIVYFATRKCGHGNCVHETKVCGCYEIWCPIKNLVLASKDDDRKKCYTLRRYYGCWKREDKYMSENWKWVENCEEAQGTSMRGKGPFWELTMF